MFSFILDTNKYTIYNEGGKRKESGKMKNEVFRNVAGVILLYLVIVVGVIAINARMKELNQQFVLTNFEEIGQEMTIFFGFKK